jgi:hypothetical protein
VCPRRSGKRHRSGFWSGSKVWLHLNLHALRADQLDTRSPVLSAAPIPPEEWSGTNGKWMEQNAHLARLFSSTPIPLALLTQLTRTTPAVTSGIHQPKAPISLLPLLLERERGARLCSAAFHQSGEENLAP